MSDRLDDFERALRAAVNIDLSAGFETGLRRRLSEAPPAQRPWRWMTPVLAGLTAATVVGSLAVRRTPTAATGGGGGAPPPSVVAESAVTSTTPRVLSPARLLRRRTVPAVARRGGLRVIVPPGEREALLRFVARLETEALPPPPALAAPSALADDLPAPTPIAIAPLAVAPLAETADPPERSDS